MDLFPWTDDLITGNEMIDADHRHWVDLINVLLDSIANGYAGDYISEVLENLIVYSREHFGREETEMWRIAYAATGAHRAQHAEILKTAIELKGRLDAGEKINAPGVQNYLSTWLRAHILNEDQKLAKALKKVD